jgi:uncharacterized protein
MKTLLPSTLLLLLLASTVAAQQTPGIEPPIIIVSGEALVYASPDKVVLNFGIETRDTRLVAAKQKNAEIWKKAAAVLKERGIPSKDVQTDYLSIEPCYSSNEIEEPIGYLTRNMFLVTLTDPAKVESLISQMLRSA